MSQNSKANFAKLLRKVGVEKSVMEKSVMGNP